MKTVKEIASKYVVHTKEYGDVIPVVALETVFKEFQNKPYQEQLSELENAMGKLNSMINDLGKEIDD
jgi:hypothetical protein